MDSHELKNLHEAYINVYEVTGRDEMISSNIERAKATRSPSVMSRPSTNVPKPTGQISKPNNTFSQLDKTARDTAGRVGEVIGRNRGKQTGIPGGGLVGGLIGRNRAQGMYDRAKETVGSFLKQDYEPDMFDIILEYLVAEGYADTNENALVIMANMSEDWRQSIVEYAGGGGSTPSIPGAVGAVEKIGNTIQKVFGAKTKPTKKQTPDGFNPHQKFN